MTQTQLQTLWIGGWLLALLGYAVLGRGFAYTFFGEFVIVLGLMIFILSRRVMLIFSDSVLLLWFLFAFWGFCRTVPFLTRYRMEAVRDAVLWGYGLVALFLVAYVNNSSQVSRILFKYSRFVRWYLPFLPFLVLLTFSMKDSMPTIPWSDNVGILDLKRDDAAVHLAGSAVFLFSFGARPSISRRSGITVLQFVGYIGWAITALTILIMNRSGLLAIILPIALLMITDIKNAGWKVALSAVAGGVFCLLILESNLLSLHIKGKEFTTNQIGANVSSIVGVGGTDSSLEGTKTWRLIWWRHIINYTIYGPYFWTGKGFGVNLAVEDGPPGISSSDASLRSPHNGNMTILARMGVPGLTLWALLNGIFVYRLVKGYWTASRMGSAFWRKLNLWILCYWFTSFISMSFDVYLEGPSGGIWFWSIIGFGVASMRIQRSESLQLQLEQRAMNRQMSFNGELVSL